MHNRQKPDFLLYHEFSLTGYSGGSRTEKLKYTVIVPGPETERLGKIARDCDTYVAYEMTKPVMAQYVQEFPINHLDLPRDQLPETGAAMKELMESINRFNHPEKYDLPKGE